MRGEERVSIDAVRTSPHPTSLPWFTVPLSRHPGRRPGIHALAEAPERTSNVLGAEWIPASARMTVMRVAVDPGCGSFITGDLRRGGAMGSL